MAERKANEKKIGRYAGQRGLGLGVSTDMAQFGAEIVSSQQSTDPTNYQEAMALSGGPDGGANAMFDALYQ